MKLCGIYLITHVESGRKYVGQSRDIHARWIEHSRGYGKTWLARTIHQDGWCAFRTGILEPCEPNQLNDCEARWIASLGTLSPAGFNLTTGGLYFKQSAETIARTAAFHTGRKRSPATCEKIGAAKLGMKHSVETRAKMSAAQVGRIFSLETRAKLSENAKRQVWNAESRAKIAASNAARVFTQEMRDKRSVMLTGKKLTPEHVAKVKAALTGRKCTPEHVAKSVATKRANRLKRLQLAARFPATP